VCLEIDGFPILLLRQGDALRVYVNACPHQFLPLDHKGNRLLSEDGKIIRCTSHGAGFSVATGEGIEGHGIGECLDAIPVEITGDAVVIAG
jgi:nitrite reductase/ring-hydroxylating ferredoxin subunit